MVEFADGLKLRKMLAFIKDMVGKHFPAQAPPTTLMEKGKELANEIAGARAAARARIWSLIKFVNTAQESTTTYLQ